MAGEKVRNSFPWTEGTNFLSIRKRCKIISIMPAVKNVSWIFLRRHIPGTRGSCSYNSFCGYHDLANGSHIWPKVEATPSTAGEEINLCGLKLHVAFTVKYRFSNFNSEHDLHHTKHIYETKAALSCFWFLIIIFRLREFYCLSITFAHKHTNLSFSISLCIKDRDGNFSKNHLQR